jgi:hypothetical protein
VAGEYYYYYYYYYSCYCYYYFFLHYYDYYYHCPSPVSVATAMWTLMVFSFSFAPRPSECNQPNAPRTSSSLSAAFLSRIYQCTNRQEIRRRPVRQPRIAPSLAYRRNEKSCLSQERETRRVSMGRSHHFNDGI